VRLDSPLKNLTPSPSAKACRELLKNIPYQDEKRLGNMWYALGYGVASLTFMGAAILFVGIYIEPSKLNAFIYAFLIATSSITGGMISLSREQKLFNKNQISRTKETVSKYLAPGEEFLCMFVGQANKLPPAEWLGDISIYSYLIFTTDRLLIITFKPELIGSNQINDHIAIGEFEKIIVDVHTCSLLDSSSFTIGGIIHHPALLNLTHTKVIVCPIGQHEPYRWIIDNKHTRHGKTLAKIRQHLACKTVLNV
jgi:hypothetical protein